MIIPSAILFFLLDRDQLNFENQRRIWPDASHTPLTIGEIQRNKELPFRPLLHKLQSLGPAKDHGVNAGLHYVAQKNAAALLSEDITEAMSTFMEKRTPVFKGK